MSLTQFRNSTSRSLQRNLSENVSNRAYVVAFAIREAFATANTGNSNNGSNYDWDELCTLGDPPSCDWIELDCTDHDCTQTTPAIPFLLA
ncbi:10165_t:CDS:2 [Dentiscutata heterogama]|uniref:10165_t:CDS:1 n=1 Tax=Dentiscutata heterogama TaxID=1316150 RepID=A0ACA9JUY1_9GLOM|nr:10165_t:CDS:2 [Dentiscutata heterogama]